MELSNQNGSLKKPRESLKFKLYETESQYVEYSWKSADVQINDTYFVFPDAEFANSFPSSNFVKPRIIER